MTVLTDVLEPVDSGPATGQDLLAERAREARRLVVDMAASPRGCHLGGSLSVLDILIASLHRASSGDGTEVVLSKGHAAAASTRRCT